MHVHPHVKIRAVQISTAVRTVSAQKCRRELAPKECETEHRDFIADTSGLYALQATQMPELDGVQFLRICAATGALRSSQLSVSALAALSALSRARPPGCEC